MLILHHAHAKTRQSDGVRTLEASSAAFGITAFEIRLIELDAGACLPRSQHAGQLAVLALGGQGKLRLPSGPQRFVAPCSLFIPPHVTYQIDNDAGIGLQLLFVCSPPPSWVD